MLDWKRSALAALAALFGFLPAASGDNSPIRPGQVLYGLYRICGSIERAQSLARIAAETVENGDIKPFIDYMKKWNGCIAKTTELTVIEEYPALSGGMGWNIVYDTKSDDICAIKIHGIDTRVPCRLSPQTTKYYYAYYTNDSGQTIIVLAETFPSNIVESYLKRNE